MLYLEDFLDLIESLPLEMREKLTEVRELDLQVQNGLDNLSERSKTFFKQCSESKIAGQPRTTEYQKILSQYDDLLHVADDKVHLANNLYGIVQRFVAKLDQELHKFKIELEADNAGITEVLERRSKELDAGPSSSRNDRRSLTHDNRSNATHNNHYSNLHNNTSGLDIDANFDLANFGFNLGVDSFDTFTPITSHGGSSGGLAALLSNVPPTSPGAISEDLSIAPSSAAPSSINGDRKRSRANPSSNRRLSSTGSRLPSQSRQNMSTGRGSRRPRRGGGSGSGVGTGAIEYTNSNSPASVSSESLFNMIVDNPTMLERQNSSQRRGSSAIRGGGGSSSAANDDDDDEDGMETRWCICNDVSYGEMIMCDNKDCPIEWFHYGCVNITSAPRGKWYCPQCAAAMKRRTNNSTPVPAPATGGGLTPSASSSSLTTQTSSSNTSSTTTIART